MINSRKIIIAVVAAVVCLVVGILVVSGLNSKNGTGNKKHEHSYIEIQIPSTCSQDGYNQFECECGDFYKGEKVEAKKEHVGSISCSVCGLNYFDEIKSLIIANGTISNNGQYYYSGNEKTDGEITLSAYLSYDPANMNIFIAVNYDMGFLGAYNFMIAMYHPSEGGGLVTGKYDWIIGINNSTAMGVLNGTTFSSLTSELSISYNDGFNSYSLSSIRSLAASFAHSAIYDGLLPLLRLSEKGLTPQVLGFKNYVL